MFRSFLVSAVAVFLLAFTAPASQAQSVTYGGPQTTLPFSGLQSPGTISVAVNGDTLVADNATGNLYILPNGCHASSCQEVVTGFPTPFAGAVEDQTGVITVEQQNVGNGTQALYTLPSGCLALSCGSVAGVPQGESFSLAIDAQGDIYAGGQGGCIWEKAFGAAGFSSNSCATYSNPSLAPLDSNDIVASSSAEENPSLGGQIQEGTSCGGTASCGFSTIATNLLYPAVIATNPLNLSSFFALNANSNGTFNLYSVPLTCNSFTCETLLATVPSTVVGMAADKEGHVYVADSANGVYAISPYNFGNVAMASPASVTLNFQVLSSVTIGSAQALTVGAANQDYTITANTCIGAQTAPVSCTLTVQFSPVTAGWRQGAVNLLDGSGNLLVTELIDGVGVAPQLIFPGGPKSTLHSNTQFPLWHVPSLLLDPCTSIGYVGKCEPMRIAHDKRALTLPERILYTRRVSGISVGMRR